MMNQLKIVIGLGHLLVDRGERGVFEDQLMNES
jgi:hypothetical protein